MDFDYWSTSQPLPRFSTLLFYQTNMRANVCLLFNYIALIMFHIPIVFNPFLFSYQVSLSAATHLICYDLYKIGFTQK